MVLDVTTTGAAPLQIEGSEGTGPHSNTREPHSRAGKFSPKPIAYTRLHRDSRIGKPDVLVKTGVEEIVNTDEKRCMPKAVIANHKVRCGVTPHRRNQRHRHLKVIATPRPIGRT